MPCLEIIPDSEPDPFEERIDLTSPEDVLTEIDYDGSTYEKFSWNGFAIVSTTIIGGDEEFMGAASYEQAYGSFLNYTIEDLIECPKRLGWFVVRGITGHYSKGDGWSTDDNMEFYYEYVQPATQKEIDLA
jgi:hypothetical protein